MSFYDAIRVGASGAAADFEIDRSLRYNPADITNLERTFGSASNRRTWTFSFWCKRCGLGRTSDIFSPYRGGDNSNESRIFFQDSDQLRVYDSGGVSGYPVVRTAAKFRDVGAWYHFVVAVDTTQSTASNRVKIYANGVLQELDQTTYGNQDQELGWNNNHIHRVGAYGYPSQGSLTSSHINDGYLAEVNFIDGQQLTPSSFGETNSDTGQWVPIDTSGLTFGTNGFRLNFSDNSGTTATTLGKDTSGNGNNFTPNNFSVAAGEGNDSLEDTPTNNFCTMNPLVPSPTATWANGNLDLGGSSSTQYNQNNTSTFGVTSGKWYAEVKFTLGGTTNAYMGICPINAVANANMTGSITDAAVIRMDNTLFIEGSAPSAGTSISSGDTIGIALDMDNQKVWFSVQGTYVLSGNPSTGANATFDGITAGETIAICARPLNNTLNFNFGQRPFAYTPPTGFKKLNSANLPDPAILLPNEHFNTLLYTGNDSNSRDITGVGFQPDWLWIKNRSQADFHMLQDSVRGANKVVYSNDTDSEQTDNTNGHVNSFLPDGFNVDAGAQGNVNENGEDYVAWNWNAGDTDSKTYTVTVVSDSGNKYRFDGFGTSAVTLDLAEGGTYIFNYPSAHPFRFSTTSDGTHGGGSEYTTGVTVLSSTSVQIVVAASAPTLYYYCTIHSGMGGAINTNSTLGSSNFDGSTQSTVKANTTAGFSIVTYTGTGSVATVGHGLGVAPQVVLTRSRSSGGNWGVLHTVGDPTAENRLHLNDNGGYSSYQGNYLWNDTVPTSSVFTVKQDASTNASSTTYVAYVFSAVVGYSKVGKYTGNASTDGTFSFCGFKPAWVLLKKTNSSDNWTIFDNKRDIDNSMHRRLRANIADAEATGLSSSQDQIDFLSNGFKCRSTSNNHNGNNSSNIFLAFAEAPFKNSRGR